MRILGITFLALLLMPQFKALAGIGDNYVLTDSLGRDWYNPFDGLFNMNFQQQHTAIEDAGFNTASLNDVIFMYTEKYGSNALDFNVFVSDFGFPGITPDFQRSLARTSSLTIGKTDQHRVVGLENGGAPTLDSSIIGTFDQDVLETYLPIGFMYYKASSPDSFALMSLICLFLAFFRIKGGVCKKV